MIPGGIAFQHQPLLVAGRAMQFYGLRDGGSDVDLVIHPDDFEQLRQHHPVETGEFGDGRITIGEFEIYDAFSGLPYDLLAHKAIEHGDYLVASLPALLYIAASRPGGAGLQDAQLIIEKIK